MATPPDHNSLPNAATRPSFKRFADALRHPSPQAAWGIALLVALVALAYLYATAIGQGTAFVPRVTDESSYLLQMRMLAEGRLWTDSHPPEVRPFFDSFNLLVEPKYGSMYFPGTALLYVPAVWLGLPYWLLPLIVSAACAGLFYRLATELADGVYGLIAAAMLLSLTKFRALSVMLFSQTPMLLFGLLLLLAYLRWRRRPGWGWTLLIGALAGWAGITRPADALCYAVPVGIAMLLDLWSVKDRPRAKAFVAHAAALLLGAAPFLSLQVVQNVGMAGHWWEFPEARYADETYPAPMLGFHKVDPAAARVPALPQKRDLNAQMVAVLYERHRPSRLAEVWWTDRFPQVVQFGLPNPMLAILLPLGFLGLAFRRTGFQPVNSKHRLEACATLSMRRPRIVVAAIPLLFLGFYAFYVFFIPHYMVVLAPTLILLCIFGADAVASLAGRYSRDMRSGVRQAFPLLALVAVAAALPQVRPEIHDPDLFGPGYFRGELPVIDAEMAELKSRMLASGGRAIVLFRYTSKVNAPDEEPVYNTDGAWPDDVTVIRAHDRGPANPVLFGYYARTVNQPDREVYLYDRATLTLSRLGRVGDLASR